MKVIWGIYPVLLFSCASSQETMSASRHASSMTGGRLSGGGSLRGLTVIKEQSTTFEIIKPTLDDDANNDENINYWETDNKEESQPPQEQQEQEVGGGEGEEATAVIEDEQPPSSPAASFDVDQDDGILTSLRLFDNLRANLPEAFVRADATYSKPADDTTNSKVDLIKLPKLTRQGANESSVQDNGPWDTAFCHISAITPFTYGDKVPRLPHHEDLAAMVLAAHHLNIGNGTIVPEIEGLPNWCKMRFTAEFADTEFQGGVALGHVVSQINRGPGEVERNPCAFIGAYRSAVSIPMSIVTGFSGYPQVSGGSTSAALDDKSQYPLFGRTIPTDAGNANAFVKFLYEVFNITHLAVINVNDAYGNAYVEGMRAARDVWAPEMILHQIPLDTDVGSDNLKASVEQAVASLKATTFRFVYTVVFTAEVHDALLEEAYAQGAAGDGNHTWLFGDSFLGILEGRSFEKDGPLHKSYQGCGLFEVTGGVKGFPKYDHFVQSVSELRNPTDLEYIGRLMPNHTDPAYNYPPFVNDDPTFLQEITSSFATFHYEAIIALGLAACEASAEFGLNFTGRQHYDAFLASNFSGFSGSVNFINTTGTRDPASAMYKVTNYVETFGVDDSGKEIVTFTPINTHLTELGEWVEIIPYVFNDGTSNLPSDLPPPEVLAGLQEQGVNLAVIILVPLVLFVVLGVVIFLFYENKRKKNDGVWVVNKDDLKYDDPPTIIGRGTFGLVLLAEYRGTQVAVKRVIPPKKTKKGGAEADDFSGHTSGLASGVGYGRKSSTGSMSGENENNGEDLSERSNPRESLSSFDAGKMSGVRSMVASNGRASVVNQSETTSRKKMKKEFIEEMRHLAKLRHPNITTVMGAVTKGDPMLIMEYMDHGSLYDLLHNETVAIEGELILPLMRDITRGMRFLHSSAPQILHGDLKAANILVDSRFHAKVADFGLSKKKNIGGTGTPFWMAPELLRFESTNTPATDAYAFGIILFEVFARRDPYEGEAAKEVLELVADKNVRKRPPHPRHMPETVKALMSDCLEDDAEKRPTFDEIETRLKRIDAEALDLNPGNKNKGSVSLFDIFPRHIAEALRDGRTPEAEHKDVVTIFFSDIVGFTTISSTLEPRKVATMLDRLYSKFDALSHKHDIFKVETIGDAYMAVTNLVNDQPDDHAKRIAEFAIEAIAAAQDTVIDEDEPSKGNVNIRVGFHSGPVVADVVGTRNPRYCLFGDTVNTASRMESNSEPNRIHCSKVSAAILHKQHRELQMKSRGKIHIKGKGDMTTYWVNEVGDRRVSRDVSLRKFADAIQEEERNAAKRGGAFRGSALEPLEEDDGSGMFMSSDFMSGGLSKEFALDELDEKKDEPESTEPEVAPEPTL